MRRLKHKLSHGKVWSTCWIFLRLHGELSGRVDVHEHLEFVDGDEHSNGYLRLRKKVVTPDATSEDLFREAEKWELQKLPGYVVCSGGKGTAFSGQLKGTVFLTSLLTRGETWMAAFTIFAWTLVTSTSSTSRSPAKSSRAFETRWIR